MNNRTKVFEVHWRRFSIVCCCQIQVFIRIEIKEEVERTKTVFPTVILEQYKKLTVMLPIRQNLRCSWTVNTVYPWPVAPQWLDNATDGFLAICPGGISIHPFLGKRHRHYGKWMNLPVIISRSSYRADIVLVLFMGLRNFCKWDCVQSYLVPLVKTGANSPIHISTPTAVRQVLPFNW